MQQQGGEIRPAPAPRSDGSARHPPGSSEDKAAGRGDHQRPETPTTCNGGGWRDGPLAPRVTPPPSVDGRLTAARTTTPEVAGNISGPREMIFERLGPSGTDCQPLEATVTDCKRLAPTCVPVYLCACLERSGLLGNSLRHVSGFPQTFQGFS